MIYCFLLTWFCYDNTHRIELCEISSKSDFFFIFFIINFFFAASWKSESSVICNAIIFLQSAVKDWIRDQESKQE